LTAAREHSLIDALTSANVMTFADKAYQGAGGSVWTPFKRQPQRPPLSRRQKQVNRAHARIRALGERAVATLKTWKILTKLRCCPRRATAIVQAGRRLIPVHLGHVGAGAAASLPCTESANVLVCSTTAFKYADVSIVAPPSAPPMLAEESSFPWSVFDARRHARAAEPVDSGDVEPEPDQVERREGREQQCGLSITVSGPSAGNSRVPWPTETG
jgi:hypothetical protein